MSNVHFSSATDEWATPRGLFARLNEVFQFTLDPCATAENAVCERFFSKDQDGLAHPWHGERVFMNPPYGRQIGRWVQKAASSKALVVCLLPARTDTRWWQDYVITRAAHITFVKGRLRFGEAANAAPFPSALVVFTGGVLNRDVVRMPGTGELQEGDCRQGGG